MSWRSTRSCAIVRERCTSARAMASTARLKMGDVVSVAVGAFGQDYAKSRGTQPWTSEEVRDE
eukprot:5951230-Pleurochrysis_carterae.AAC.1